MSKLRAVTLFASANRIASGAITNSLSNTYALQGVPFKRAIFLLDVTATNGNATDYLNAYIDVRGPGGTWLNAIHFTQVAGDGAAIKHYAALDTANVAATTFDVTADCASGVTKPYLWGDAVRGRFSLVDTGDVTFSLTGLLY